MLLFVSSNMTMQMFAFFTCQAINKNVIRGNKSSSSSTRMNKKKRANSNNRKKRTKEIYICDSLFYFTEDLVHLRSLLFTTHPFSKQLVLAMSRLFRHRSQKEIENKSFQILRIFFFLVFAAIKKLHIHILWHGWFSHWMMMRIRTFLPSPENEVKTVNEYLKLARKFSFSSFHFHFHIACVCFFFSVGVALWSIILQNY